MDGWSSSDAPDASVLYSYLFIDVCNRNSLQASCLTDGYASIEGRNSLQTSVTDFKHGMALLMLVPYV